MRRLGYREKLSNLAKVTLVQKFELGLSDTKGMASCLTTLGNSRTSPLVNNLPKITQLVSGRARSEPRQAGSQSVHLTAVAH